MKCQLKYYLLLSGNDSKIYMKIPKTNYGYDNFKLALKICSTYIVIYQDLLCSLL